MDTETVLIIEIRTTRQPFLLTSGILRTKMKTITSIGALLSEPGNLTQNLKSVDYAWRKSSISSFSQKGQHLMSALNFLVLADTGRKNYWPISRTSSVCFRYWNPNSTVKFVHCNCRWWLWLTLFTIWNNFVRPMKNKFVLWLVIYCD